MLATSGESGAGAQTVMSIAGHISRRHARALSHVRMEAKRRALDEIASLQRAAEVKRKEDTERREQAAVMCESVIVQESQGRKRRVAHASEGCQDASI